MWAAGGEPCIYGAARCTSLRGRSPNGTRAKAKRCDKLLRNGANCTRRHKLRTRTGGWRSGRDSGSLVGTVVVGYACSDCAISVVAAPLLVSREAALTACAKKSRLDGHPASKSLTLGVPSNLFNVPEYGRCVLNTAPNDLSLLRRGTIEVVPDSMARSVRVGSI